MLKKRLSDEQIDTELRQANGRRTFVAHACAMLPYQLPTHLWLKQGISMMPPHVMLHGGALMKLLEPARGH